MPGLEPKTRVGRPPPGARRRRARRPAARRRRGRAAATKLCSAGSSSAATSATASSSRSTRCGKASRKKPEMRTVTSIRGRPSSAERDRPRCPVTRARLRVPARPHAEQGEDLGHVVALGAHRRRAPGDEPDHPRQRAGLVAVAVEQRVGEPRADVLGRARTAARAGRPSRSCARSAARRRGRGSGRPTGPAGTWRPCSAATMASSSGVRGSAARPRRRRSAARARRRRRAAEHLPQPRRRRVPVARGERVEQRHLRVLEPVDEVAVARRRAAEAREQRRRQRRRRRARRRHQRRLVEPERRADRAPQPGHVARAAAAAIAPTSPRSCSPSGARPRTCSPSLIWMSLTSHR